MTALVGGTVGEALAVHRTVIPAASGSDGTSDRRRSVRRAATVVGVGGALLAVGGTMHPHETSGTMHESLLALIGSPAWLPAHAVLLAGMLTALAGLVLLRRHDAFPARVRPWLTATAIAWAVATPEFVPHLLAGSEHDALEVGGPTPMVETHLALSTVTSPLVGLTAAMLAVAVARATPTRPARLLAALGVVGGVGFAAAAPLLAITGNPQVSNLFAAQTLIDVWVIGTSVRLALAHRETRH
jgi:hypothetical protein